MLTVIVISVEMVRLRAPFWVDDIGRRVRNTREIHTDEIPYRTTNRSTSIVSGDARPPAGRGLYLRLPARPAGWAWRARSWPLTVDNAAIVDRQQHRRVTREFVYSYFDSSTYRRFESIWVVDRRPSNDFRRRMSLVSGKAMTNVLPVPPLYDHVVYQAVKIPW